MASQADKDRKAAGIGDQSGGGSAPTTPVVTAPVINPTTPAPVANPVIPVASQAAPYSDIAKTLIPYLSPEDAATQSTLYGLPAPTAPIPTEINGGLRNQFMGADRANQALAALENMRTAAGSPDYGPGYEFLKNSLGLLSKFGGAGAEEGMGRMQFGEFTTALNNLINSVKGDTSGTYSPYVGLAQQFLTPTFSAGDLEGTTKVGTQTLAGQYNKKLVI